MIPNVSWGNNFLGVKYTLVLSFLCTSIELMSLQNALISTVGW